MLRNVNKARLFLGLALVFTGVGASVFRTPSILFMAAMLCGAPIVASLVGRLGERGLRITCEGPTLGRVGERVNARIEVTNTGFFPLFLVHVRAGHIEFPVRPKGGHKRVDGGSYVPLIALDDEEMTIPILAPHTTVRGEIVWEMARRGVWLQSGVHAGVLDPTGLHSRLTSFTLPRQIEIRPHIVRLNRLIWSGGQGGAQRPQSAAAVSDAADIHGVRPHRPGEGLRRIHWKSTARTGVLHVVEWEEESAADMILLLDASMQGEALENAIVAAASCANYLLSTGQRIELFFWQKGDLRAPLKLVRVEGQHPGHKNAILSALTRLEPVPVGEAKMQSLAETARKFARLQAAPLFLVGAESDWRSAMMLWDNGAEPGTRCGVLLWDEDSSGFLPPRVRRVSQHDSLAAVLEREL